MPSIFLLLPRSRGERAVLPPRTALPHAKKYKEAEAGSSLAMIAIQQRPSSSVLSSALDACWSNVSMRFYKNCLEVC